MDKATDVSCLNELEQLRRDLEYYELFCAFLINAIGWDMRLEQRSDSQEEGSG